MYSHHRIPKLVMLSLSLIVLCAGVASQGRSQDRPEATEHPTKMPYRQATDNDFWVDDVHSDDYNKWINGRSGTTSAEKMKREDDLYKVGVVIEYNTNPIVRGKGSAIFLHVWRGEGKPTLGCVAVAEDNILRLLGWLDPAKKPLIIMGTESELRSIGSR